MEAIVGTLARLVGFDSTSDRSNLPIADEVCQRLAEQAARIERIPTGDAHKINVLAFLGPSAPDGLMLSGHLDVVPADQPGWNSDPFRLTDAGDRLIGRGVVDMKGFVALALVVAGRLERAQLRRPLVLLFTCDEEIGSIGAQHFARYATGRTDLPPSAIIGEPTESKVVRMHKGHMRLRVRVRGIAAHSGYPRLGDNAVEKAGRVIEALASLRRELETERSATSIHFKDYPHPILTVATIRGGSAFNIVPDACEIGVGLRLLPGQSSAAYVERIAQRLTCLGDDVALDVLNDSPPLLTAEDRPIHRRLCAMMEQKESVAVHYASDAGPLSTLGLDCVVWGPGSISVAHRPNEYILRQDLADGLERLTAIVHQSCVSPTTE